MKFVIDVPLDYIYNGKLKIHTDSVDYPCVDRWITTKINMTPYDVQIDHIRDEVWDFAKIIMADEFSGGMSIDDIEECFGGRDLLGVSKLSYKEAREKYNAWKEKKGEIKVGDELAYNDDEGQTAVVTRIIKESGTFNGFGKDGEAYREYFYRFWHKTGRSFPEVAELLNKMKVRADDV